MFSGRLVYRIVCANVNDRMQIDKLKKMNKVRSLMVGSISHDLRTPLNGILILLNLVLKLKVIPPDALIKEFI